MSQSLCDACDELELTIDDFVVSDQSPSVLWSSRYRGQYEIGPLSRIVGESSKCSVCHLVLVALGIDRDAFNTLDAEHRDAICAITWASNDRLAGSRAIVTRALMITCRPSHASWNATAKLELHEDTFPGTDDRTFLGRDVPMRIDISSLQSWLQRCSRSHKTCSRPEIDHEHLVDRPNLGGSRLKSLRVIDCQQFCITDVTFPAAEYLALSYVWGDGPRLKLLQDNSKYLQTIGSLSNLQDEIPCTIRDAMALTVGLGKKYVWVDSLCIIQDSDEDKSSFIPRMNQIYHNAQVTFVVASGDAMSGIAGLHDKPRAIRHAKKKIGPDLVLHAPHNIRDALNNSQYATRAWTFQEQYLSRRCLFFLPDQVFFQCRSSTWREDKYLEDDRVSTFPMAERTPLDMYVSCVRNFAPRSLTYKSDILKASAGMMNAIAEMKWRTSSGNPITVCGIPLGWFEYGLIWHVELTTPPMTRRSSDMPSWSWCTWQGPVSIFERLKTIDQLNKFMQCSWIRWTLHNTRNSGSKSPEILDLTISSALRSPNLFTDASKYPPVSDQATMTINSAAAYELCGTPTDIALHFATLTVDIEVLAPFVGWFQGYHIGLGNGQKISGFCQVDDHRKLELGSKMRCATVCLTTKEYARNVSFGLEAHSGSFLAYHVLLIESKPEHEHVERLGVGLILKEALDECADAVWRDVWLR